MVDSRSRANAIRALAMDAVQQAQSGHPGMPMGMADIAEVLWHRHLNHNPAAPHWPNRDRFIVSNGHGSMLLYSLLHLSGYDVSLDDLKAFRQLGSKTPGHPEFGMTPGVETTTGPLGQGLANAVGMAMAERQLAAEFNTDIHQLIDHFTYVFTGDGCLMEGISHEACSLAGTLGLGKLIVFWDDNGISIDGDLSTWYNEDTMARFSAYGWQVIGSVDGHDAKAIDQAIIEAKADLTRPTFIALKTVIGFGAPNLQGSAKSHGAPLGEQEIANARKQLQWDFAPFEIPEAILNSWRDTSRIAEQYHQWEDLLKAYQADHPEKAVAFTRRLNKMLPEGWNETVNQFLSQCLAQDKPMATRKASQQCLNAFAPEFPELFGGSADLSESNNTLWQGAKAISADEPAGNYCHYGVREFGMAAIMNGMALYGGFIPYGGTFLVFSDYARNAIRMSALMHQQVIYVLTHDSIGLGEDGPTHQPIEHLTMLRATPHCHVWRPCDLVETAIAWESALVHTQGPSALVLSRQGLAPQPRCESLVADIRKGGYILFEPQEPVQAIIIATGSEVMIAMEAAATLNEQGISTRVVSMPCVELFEAQSATYRERVLPTGLKARVAVEAGATLGWYKYVGLEGHVVGIDRYGESAPAKDVYHALGVTSERVAHCVRQQVDAKIKL